MFKIFEIAIKFIKMVIKKCIVFQFRFPPKLSFQFPLKCIPEKSEHGVQNTVRNLTRQLFLYHCSCQSRQGNEKKFEIKKMLQF